VIKVLIVDDKPEMRMTLAEKLSFFPEYNCVGTASDGVEAVSSVKSNQPDVILMDLQMPHMDGIDATLEIKSIHPEVKILITTVMDDNAHIFHAIKAGADGYLLKDTDPDQLSNAIQEVLTGGAPMSPNVAQKALHLLRSGGEPERNGNKDLVLSRREVEILKELSKGYASKEIAESLFIAPSTVRKHVENICRELRVHNKVDALDLGRRKGLL
jgi:DNA-binding NarL/FixJ family response regulator